MLCVLNLWPIGTCCPNDSCQLRRRECTQLHNAHPAFLPSSYLPTITHPVCTQPVRLCRIYQPSLTQSALQHTCLVRTSGLSLFLSLLRQLQHSTSRLSTRVGSSTSVEFRCQEGTYRHAGRKLGESCSLVIHARILLMMALVSLYIPCS